MKKITNQPMWLCAAFLFLTLHISAQRTPHEWHVTVDGRGFTYNSSICTTFSCSLHIYNSSGSVVPMSTPPVTLINSLNVNTTDHYNLILPRCSSVTTTVLSRTPCGYYNGTNWENGDGTLANPWSLDFALSNPPDPTQVTSGNYTNLDAKSPTTGQYIIPRWIQPGDIIWVHEKIDPITGANVPYNGNSFPMPVWTPYDYNNTSTTYTTCSGSTTATHNHIYPTTAGGPALAITATTSLGAGEHMVTIDVGNMTNGNAIKNSTQKLYLHTKIGSGASAIENVYQIIDHSYSPSTAGSSVIIDLKVKETIYLPRGITALAPPSTSAKYDVFTFEFDKPRIVSSTVNYHTNYKCYLEGTAKTSTNLAVPVMVKAAPCEHPVIDGNQMFYNINLTAQSSSGLGSVPYCGITQTGILDIVGGHDVWFYGLEVTNYNKVRYTTVAGNPSAGSKTLDCGEGVNIVAAGIKLIDMQIHDIIGQGVSAFGLADGYEINGCSIFNNGWNYVPPLGITLQDRGDGHNIYTQTTCSSYPCTTNDRTIKNNIIFGAYYYNIKLFTQTSGLASIQNYNINKNIVFNAGTSRLDMTSIDHGSWQGARNFLIDSHNGFTHDLKIQNNHFFYFDIYDVPVNFDNMNTYTPFSVSGTAPFSLSNPSNVYKPSSNNIVIGQYDGYLQDNFTIDHNYFCHASVAMYMQNIEHLSYLNNVHMGDNTDIELRNSINYCINSAHPYKPFDYLTSFDYNTYYEPWNRTYTFETYYSATCCPVASNPGCCATNTCAPGTICCSGAKYAGYAMTNSLYNILTGWQSFYTTPGATTPNADYHSSLYSGPSSNEQSDPYIHDYNPGLCNLMVYNWSNAANINLDLSFIPNGNSYEIINGQDPIEGVPGSTSIIKAPSTYSGTPVSIAAYPVRSSTTGQYTYLGAAQPNGIDYTETDLTTGVIRKMNRLAPAISTAPTYIPLIVKFFPYHLQINSVANGVNCTDGYTLTVVPTDNLGNVISDPYWKISNVSWTVPSGFTSPGNSTTLVIPANAMSTDFTYTFTATVTDINCMQQTASFDICCPSFPGAVCLPAPAPPMPGSLNENNKQKMDSALSAGNNSNEYINLAPNPTSSTTTLQYNLSRDRQVKAEIFDETGKLIETIINARQSAGKYSYELFRNGHCRAGTYTLMMYQDGRLTVRKIVKL